MLGNLVSPARRHLCELCENVFQCHVCEIDCWHPIHQENYKGNLFQFVCIPCAKRHKMFYLTTICSADGRSGRTGNMAKVYDYLTGRLVQLPYNIPGRKINIRLWSEDMYRMKLCNDRIIEQNSKEILRVQREAEEVLR